jgi:hypothetical protein
MHSVFSRYLELVNTEYQSIAWLLAHIDSLRMDPKSRNGDDNLPQLIDARRQDYHDGSIAACRDAPIRDWANLPER